MNKFLKYLCIVIALVFVLYGCVPGVGNESGENNETSIKSPVSTTDGNTEEITAAPNYEITDAQKPDTDPYATVSAAEFYADYQPAENYWDAYYRTQHGFMSGSLDVQDQRPTVSEYRPQSEGYFIRNSSALYSQGGKAYTVVDAYGEIAFTVYEGGAYVTLEEVAAYVFAFGDIPANYITNKSGSPNSSVWGEYLRLNHSKFSGSTSKYPYEPQLPNINGCGGDLQYYEIDIGTTGTDCDPSYKAVQYNDGSKITRGAARIVYARFDANNDKIIDINEKYLFYTYNHYNDFQEYLNYEGGWGEMFGNITGGGTISSKTDYKPTPYIESVLKPFVAVPEIKSSTQLHFVAACAYRFGCYGADH